MASGPRYNVPMRRRREDRTDYHQRLRLLKSGKPRLVVRISNQHVRGQLVTLGATGDETLVEAHSRDLVSYGWEAPTSNTPAAYLTGFLLGKRAVAEGVSEAVLDIGLNSASPGSKVFSVQEGAIDAGLDSPHNDTVFPEWSRTRGEHISVFAEEQGGLYSSEFDATTLPAHFDMVRETLEEEL